MEFADGWKNPSPVAGAGTGREAMETAPNGGFSAHQGPGPGLAGPVVSGEFPWEAGRQGRLARWSRASGDPVSGELRSPVSTAGADDQLSVRRTAGSVCFAGPSPVFLTLALSSGRFVVCWVPIGILSSGSIGRAPARCTKRPFRAATPLGKGGYFRSRVGSSIDQFSRESFHNSN